MKSHAPLPILLLAIATLWLPSCSKETLERVPAGTGLVPVTVRDQGAEPRALLLHDVTGTPLQSSKLEVSMSMGVDFDGQAIAPETIPGTIVTLDFDVTSSAPERVVPETYECSVLIAGAAITDYGSDMERLAHFNRELTHQDPVGRTGRMTRAANGQVLEVDLKTPAGATTTLRHFFGNLDQALQQLAIPFPAEEVGVGARWTAELPVKITGMELLQMTEYRLVAMEGNRVTVALTARCLAEPQLFRLPNMPDDARCELIDLDGTATGELTVDLSRPFPIAGELSYQFDMQMRIMAERETQSLNAHIEMYFHLTTP